MCVRCARILLCIPVLARIDINISKRLNAVSKWWIPVYEFVCVCVCELVAVMCVKVRLLVCPRPVSAAIDDIYLFS